MGAIFRLQRFAQERIAAAAEGGGIGAAAEEIENPAPGVKKDAAGVEDQAPPDDPAEP
jgi:hypothetical protein